MRWLKRSLWPAAWAIWLWLGVGLYRELPRNLDAPAAQLPLREGEEFLGFLDGANELATMESRGVDKPRILRIWNAASGLLARQFDGPIEPKGVHNFSFLPRQQLVLGLRRARLPRPATKKAADDDFDFEQEDDDCELGKEVVAAHQHDESPSVLDLRTGRWLDLPARCDGRRVFHPEKPWAAFRVAEPKVVDEPESTTVLVVDLRDGKTLFQWNEFERHQNARRLYGDPVFVGESMIAIPTHKPWDGDDVNDDRLELWSIPAGDRPLREFHHVLAGDDLSSTTTGRIAWHIVSDDPWIDVFDVHQGRFVLQYPPKRTPFTGGNSGPVSMAHLSADGKGVLLQDKLLDVDSGRILWEGRKETPNAYLSKSEESFELVGGRAIAIAEWWFVNVGRNFRLHTDALRDFSTGRLLFRYRAGEHEHSLGNDISSDFKWLYRRDDHVLFTLPPSANFPLLVLCQAVLALPLVLVWAGLRWRKRIQRRSMAA